MRINYGLSRANNDYNIGCFFFKCNNDLQCDNSKDRNNKSLCGNFLPPDSVSTHLKI